MKYGDITRQDESDQLPVPFIGTIFRDSSLASGTQAITGIGFKPSIIQFIGGQSETVEFCWHGFANATTNQCYTRRTASSFEAQGAFSIFVYQDLSNTYKGKILTMDSDGFTITWTRTGTPTGTLQIKFMASK